MAVLAAPPIDFAGAPDAPNSAAEIVAVIAIGDLPVMTRVVPSQPWRDPSGIGSGGTAGYPIIG